MVVPGPVHLVLRHCSQACPGDVLQNLGVSLGGWQWLWWRSSLLGIYYFVILSLAEVLCHGGCGRWVGGWSHAVRGRAGWCRVWIVLWLSCILLSNIEFVSKRMFFFSITICTPVQLQFLCQTAPHIQSPLTTSLHCSFRVCSMIILHSSSYTSPQLLGTKDLSVVRVGPAWIARAKNRGQDNEGLTGIGNITNQINGSPYGQTCICKIVNCRT